MDEGRQLVTPHQGRLLAGRAGCSSPPMVNGSSGFARPVLVNEVDARVRARSWSCSARTVVAVLHVLALSGLSVWLIVISVLAVVGALIAWLR